MKTYHARLLKRIIFILLIVLVCAGLQACAYTAVSTVSVVVTGKSIGDHAVSHTVPNADCGLGNLRDDKYYCEVRDISRTYNRWGI